MTDKLDPKVIKKIVEATMEDPELALEFLKEAVQVESAFPRFRAKEKEDRKPTIPDDPILSDIQYLNKLRKGLHGRRPDPLVLAVIKAIMTKYGYPMLAKVIVKISRKLGFELTTKDIEEVLHKYGAIIVPFMAILLVDVLRKYQKSTEDIDTLLKD